MALEGKSAIEFADLHEGPPAWVRSAWIGSSGASPPTTGSNGQLGLNLSAHSGNGRFRRWRRCSRHLEYCPTRSRNIATDVFDDATARLRLGGKSRVRFAPRADIRPMPAARWVGAIFLIAAPALGAIGAGRPLRTVGACPLRQLQETARRLPYLPPEQPAALRPRLL